MKTYAFHLKVLRRRRECASLGARGLQGIQALGPQMQGRVVGLFTAAP